MDNLHTTVMGAERVRHNIGLPNNLDIIDWAKDLIQSAPKSSVIRQGKNWYITHDGCILTVNGHSFTLITAHRIKE